MKRSTDEQRLLDLGLSKMECDDGREWFSPSNPDVVQAQTDANGGLLPGGRPAPPTSPIGELRKLAGAVPLALSAFVTAEAVLAAARAHLGSRAVTYDSLAGERSMAHAVAIFNLRTGHALTEDGWLLLEAVKFVRGRAAPGYHADSYEARARAAGGV
jgi:hypothetical protein